MDFTSNQHTGSQPKQQIVTNTRQKENSLQRVAYRKSSDLQLNGKDTQNISNSQQYQQQPLIQENQIIRSNQKDSIKFGGKSEEQVSNGQQDESTRENKSKNVQSNKVQNKRRNTQMCVDNRSNNRSEFDLIEMNNSEVLSSWDDEKMMQTPEKSSQNSQNINNKQEISSIDQSNKLNNLVGSDLLIYLSLTLMQNYLNFQKFFQYSRLPKIPSKYDKLNMYQFIKRGQISDFDRRYIWLFASGALRQMFNCDPSQSYAQLLKYTQNSFPNPNFKQIQVDLNRTFQEEAIYKNPQMIQKIDNILRAYSIKNPTIALVDQKVFSQIFQEKYPDLFGHLMSLGCDPSLITFQWFACFFAYNVPFKTLIRLWDLFFLKGVKILFRFSLAVIHFIKQDLIQTQDFFASMPRYKVSERQINQKRDLWRQPVIDEIQGIQIEIKESINSSINRVKFLNKFYLFTGIAKTLQSKQTGFDILKTECVESLTCKEKWPVCLFDFTYKNKVPEFFVFRVHSSKVVICEDHFSVENLDYDRTLKCHKDQNRSMLRSLNISLDERNLMLSSSNQQNENENTNKSSKLRIDIDDDDNFDDKDLLIERNRHYCCKQSIEQFKHLIRKNDHFLYTSSHLNFKIDQDTKSQEKIEMFVQQINHLYEESGKIQTLLRCLKRSNSEYTQFVPTARIRTSSHEEDKFRSIRKIAKTPHAERFKDFRKRTQSGKLDTRADLKDKLNLQKYKGEIGNLEICTLACLFRNLDRKQLENYLYEGKKQGIELFETFLEGFDQEQQRKTATNSPEKIDQTSQY
ncbi:gtpase-activating protein [Stylonychia lemnae]|uniref:Gtpase-activating protein n=1 Tax=Stylonychia lemnae TaxID=5949 RepID=A0A077ZX28_STYLE|nr:gtpase-activating protein [Stylonychia lemnae]|eukprot:CDW74131.1 gtpase-activating protein [Stylonychia lemnae]